MPFISNRVTFSHARLTKLMCCLSLVLFVWKDAYAAKSPHDTQLQVSLIAQHHTSGETWLDGGLGRFDLSSNQVLAELQMLYRYKFTRSLSFITHLKLSKRVSRFLVVIWALQSSSFTILKTLIGIRIYPFLWGNFFYPLLWKTHERFGKAHTASTFLH